MKTDVPLHNLLISHRNGYCQYRNGPVLYGIPIRFYYHKADTDFEEDVHMSDIVCLLDFFSGIGICVGKILFTSSQHRKTSL